VENLDISLGVAIKWTDVIGTLQEFNHRNKRNFTRMKIRISFQLVASPNFTIILKAMQLLLLKKYIHMRVNESGNVFYKRIL
jgi:hypothetical protein